MIPWVNGAKFIAPAVFQKNLLFASLVQRSGMDWHLGLGHRTVVTGRCKPFKMCDTRKSRLSAGMDEKIEKFFFNILLVPEMHILF